jgi:hypothetical protein
LRRVKNTLTMAQTSDTQKLRRSERERKPVTPAAPVASKPQKRKRTNTVNTGEKENHIAILTTGVVPNAKKQRKTEVIYYFRLFLTSLINGCIENRAFPSSSSTSGIRSSAVAAGSPCLVHATATLRKRLACESGYATRNR